jgi:hypothetical protein
MLKLKPRSAEISWKAFLHSLVVRENKNKQMKQLLGFYESSKDVFFPSQPSEAFHFAAFFSCKPPFCQIWLQHKEKREFWRCLIEDFAPFGPKNVRIPNEIVCRYLKAAFCFTTELQTSCLDVETFEKPRRLQLLFRMRFEAATSVLKLTEEKEENKGKENEESWSQLLWSPVFRFPFERIALNTSQLPPDLQKFKQTLDQKQKKKKKSCEKSSPEFVST